MGKRSRKRSHQLVSNIPTGRIGNDAKHCWFNHSKPKTISMNAARRVPCKGRPGAIPNFIGMTFKKEEKIDTHAIVSSFLSFISNNSKLSKPLYLKQIQSETDVNSLELTPLIYVWNENRKTGSFTVSVNGKTVDYLLEGIVSKEHSQFNAIRDEAISALSKLLQEKL
jgi:hypothetical protein